MFRLAVLLDFLGKVSERFQLLDFFADAFYIGRMKFFGLVSFHFFCIHPFIVVVGIFIDNVIICNGGRFISVQHRLQTRNQRTDSAIDSIGGRSQQFP